MKISISSVCDGNILSYIVECTENEFTEIAPAHHNWLGSEVDDYVDLALHKINAALCPEGNDDASLKNWTGKWENVIPKKTAYKGHLDGVIIFGYAV